MIYPYSFHNKMELHYPMQWARLRSLMVQYHLSESGSHSSNTGIPIGGLPSPVQKGV